MRVVKFGLTSGLFCGSIGVLFAGGASAQSFKITNDTFLDSGSPGSFNPNTGQRNVDPSVSIINGIDVYSYGADGKIKAVAANYSSAYPFVSYTHALITFPQSFWNTIGSGPVSKAVVTYYLFNDSLSTSDTHNDLEMHPLKAGFVAGVGSQNKSPDQPIPDPNGGATWLTTDGKVADAWQTPGGDYDSQFVTTLKPVGNPSYLPTGLAKNSPISWDIAPLLNNSQSRADLENFGALIKVVDETTFPPTSQVPIPPGVNDFVSLYSANYMTALGTVTTDPEFLPTISLPEPGTALAGMIFLAGLCHRRRR